MPVSMPSRCPELQSPRVFCVQPDLIFSPERDAARQPAETTTGRNALLLRLGVREDACEDVLNPGGRDWVEPAVKLRRRVWFCPAANGRPPLHDASTCQGAWTSLSADSAEL